MMHVEQSPRVSVGLPVYNGENYLAQAIESVLAQTFQDFELVISDNASIDRTQEICESFATRDPRIRYFRQPVNRGAGFNYNFVFHESRGQYFKWLAHDDFIAPTWMSACVGVLEARPSLVLAYTHFIEVDGNSDLLRVVSRTRAQDENESRRLWDMMEGHYTCEEVFGLIRSSVLSRTPLIQNYTDSDRTLLGELALYGKFGEVGQPLQYRRLHPESSVKMNPVFHERAIWFDPSLKDRLVLSAWRQFFHMLAAILRVPMSRSARLSCCWQAIRWFKWRWRWMFKELFAELWYFWRTCFSKRSTVP